LRDALSQIQQLDDCLVPAIASTGKGALTLFAAGHRLHLGHHHQSPKPFALIDA
jgi:hypothetical protein